MSTDLTNRPILSVRLGIIDAAAWRNRDDDGKPRGVSISLTKRYYDAAEKEWKNSRCYLAPQEVSAAMAVLRNLEEQLMSIDATTLDGQAATSEADA